MRTFAVAFVLISAAILFAAAPAAPDAAPFFQAFCNDGDGPLSDWLASRYDAYAIGREHELVNRGHRWDILVQEGKTIGHVPVCARLSDVPNDLVKLDNTCGKCVKFLVSRTYTNGKVNARAIKIQPNKSRQFRKLPKSVVKVEAESECSQ